MNAGRWAVAVLGLAVIVAGLLGIEEPWRQVAEFRAVVECGDCFPREQVAIAGKRTYTTTTTSTDANGITSTTTTTHHEITWQRVDGSRESREVVTSLYDKAAQGGPATLRLWHGEVVGVEVAGASDRFLPAPGRHLGYWLLVIHLGLGVLLWGLLFGWWDGFGLLVGRVLAWILVGVVPIFVAASALAFGLESGFGLVAAIVLTAVVSGMAVLFLRDSLDG